MVVSTVAGTWAVMLEEIILTDCDDGTSGSFEVLRLAVDLGEFNSLGGGVFGFVMLSDPNDLCRF